MVLSRGMSAPAKRWLIRLSPATFPMKSSTTAVMGGLPPRRSYSDAGAFCADIVAHPGVINARTTRIPTRRVSMGSPSGAACGRAVVSLSTRVGRQRMHARGSCQTATRSVSERTMLERAGAELIRRMAAGDRQALAPFYDRYAPLTYPLVLRIVRDRADAADVLQDVFWEAWLNAGRYD